MMEVANTSSTLEVYMSDEDLEVLITLDDPWYGPDDDTFHHLQPDTERASSDGPIDYK
jgi:hypothetical protein